MNLIKKILIESGFTFQPRRLEQREEERKEKEEQKNLYFNNLLKVYIEKEKKFLEKFGTPSDLGKEIQNSLNLNGSNVFVKVYTRYFNKNSELLNVLKREGLEGLEEELNLGFEVSRKEEYSLGYNRWKKHLLDFKINYSNYTLCIRKNYKTYYEIIDNIDTKEKLLEIVIKKFKEYNVKQKLKEEEFKFQPRRIQTRKEEKKKKVETIVKELKLVLPPFKVIENIINLDYSVPMFTIRFDLEYPEDFDTALPKEFLDVEIFDDYSCWYIFVTKNSMRRPEEWDEGTCNDKESLIKFIKKLLNDYNNEYLNENFKFQPRRVGQRKEQKEILIQKKKDIFHKEFGTYDDITEIVNEICKKIDPSIRTKIYRYNEEADHGIDWYEYAVNCIVNKKHKLIGFFTISNDFQLHFETNKLQDDYTEMEIKNIDSFKNAIRVWIETKFLVICKKT